MNPDNGNREFNDLCSKISSELMRPLVKQKENIYIDADLLFDFKLGALLSMTRYKAEYDYILENIPAYLKAPSIECAKFFPRLGYTEEDITKQLNNPKLLNAITVISPPTRFIEELGGIIRVINEINRSKEGDNSLRITINQREQLLHPHTKKVLNDIIHNFDSTISVEYTNFKTWKDVPAQLLANQDVICVYDVKDFLMEGTTSQKLLAHTDELSMTDIIALAQADNTEELDIRLANQADILQMMCAKFSFIGKTLLMEKSPPTKKDE